MRPVSPPLTRGFTLIELMVVIAIMAILAAIAVPDMIRASRGIQLMHQAKEMEGAIKFARAKAMQLGQVVVMCRSDAAQTACNRGSPTADWSTNGWITFVNVDGDASYTYTPANDGPLLAIKQPSAQGVSIMTRTGAQLANYIAFNPAGESTGNLRNTGMFTFAHTSVNSDSYAYLTLNVTGRVRVYNNDQCLLANSGCLESN